jgi:integrase
MITDFRKLLEAVAVPTGFAEPVLDRTGKPVRDARGRIRLRGTVSAKMFRHSYCAARLQTLDQGAPVSLYTVSRELGHGSRDMVERVYSHLGTVRHRSETVEYRVEQHAEVLHDRLAALPAV